MNARPSSEVMSDTSLILSHSLNIIIVIIIKSFGFRAEIALNANLDPVLIQILNSSSSEPVTRYVKKESWAWDFAESRMIIDFSLNINIGIVAALWAFFVCATDNQFHPAPITYSELMTVTVLFPPPLYQRLHTTFIIIWVDGCDGSDSMIRRWNRELC